VLKVFEASPRRFYYGGATVLSYRVNDESSEVTINISVKRPGSTERLTVLRLGRQQTNVLHTVRWRNRHAFAGVLRLRLNARDGSGLPLTTTSAQELGTESVRFISHVFPVRGPFDFGGPDSRFGADRGDHIHAGQDMSAAQGTPLAAIRAGRISYVGYQAGGAGNYVVLDADGEVFDYVYMHLETGSTSVSGGERVRTGQRIARVGSTGASTGPHLHFEIWRGPWFGGGEPIDPLPKLQAWLRQAH
jgi:murein DD-endopeptidase MepM/ murein hydrolase activator NlpD